MSQVITRDMSQVITEQFTEYEPDMKPVAAGEECDTAPLLNHAGT